MSKSKLLEKVDEELAKAIEAGFTSKATSLAPSASKAPKWVNTAKWRKAAGMTLDSETDYDGDWRDFPTVRVTEMLSILKRLEAEDE